MHLLYRLRLEHMHRWITHLLVADKFETTCIDPGWLATILPRCELNLLRLVLMSVWLLVCQPFSPLEIFELCSYLRSTWSADWLGCSHRAWSSLLVDILDCNRDLILSISFSLKWLSLNSVTVVGRICLQLYSLKLLVIDCVVRLKLLYALNQVHVLLGWKVTRTLALRSWNSMKVLQSMSVGTTNFARLRFRNLLKQRWLSLIVSRDVGHLFVH